VLYASNHELAKAVLLLPSMRRREEAVLHVAGEAVKRGPMSRWVLDGGEAAVGKVFLIWRFCLQPLLGSNHLEISQPFAEIPAL